MVAVWRMAEGKRIREGGFESIKDNKANKWPSNRENSNVYNLKYFEYVSFWGEYVSFLTYYGM